MHQILFYLLAVANLISLVHLGAYVVGANAYDIMEFRKLRHAKKTAGSKPAFQPLISVIVPAHNESVVIKRTLDSIRASSYKNIEIIVVDDGSTDTTNSVVREYIKGIPVVRTSGRVGVTRSISRLAKGRFNRNGTRNTALESTTITTSTSHSRIYERITGPSIRVVNIYQKNGGKASAMNNAISNYAHGDLVMCLDADSMLQPKAIERAVAYFRDPKIIGVAANVRVMASKSIVSTVQRFEHMIGYRSKKFYTLTNSEFIVGGVASTYRRDVLERVGYYDTDTITEDIGLSMKLVASEGNRDKRIVYAADVVAMTEGVTTFKQLMRQRYRWKMGSLQNLFKYRAMIGRGDRSKHSRMLTYYRLPMAIICELLLILEPLMLAYIIYLSIAHHSFSILIGAWLTITLYVLWTLWPDEHLSVKEKLKLSVVALGIYGCFYIMDVVQISAILKCLKNYRQIILGSKDATWVSPTRVGQAISA